MLNPWLSLSFQAARFGWEAQTAVIDQLMRIADVGTFDQKAAGSVDTNKMAPPTEDRMAVEAPPSPVEAGAPAKRSVHREAAQKTFKIHKERGRGTKRRLSR
jgi:hypothetical protein